MSLIHHDTNPVTERIIGAAIEVHRRFGPGLLESAYQYCLGRELEFRGVRYRSEVACPLEYRGAALDRAYLLDFLVEDRVIVEVKAVEKLIAIHQSQLLTYLRLTKLSAGLLINFNVKVLKDGIQRILC